VCLGEALTQRRSRSWPRAALPDAYLDRRAPWPERSFVLPDSRGDGLQHLALLLRDRFGRGEHRTFVMLAVDAIGPTRINTDDKETQRLPVLPL